MLRIKASYQNTFIHSPVSYLMPIHIIFMKRDQICYEILQIEPSGLEFQVKYTARIKFNKIGGTCLVRKTVPPQ